MNDNLINAILDTARCGDRIAVTRRNSSNYTSRIEGPVLAEPEISRAVGIDLLDGAPHVIRREDGAVFGHIVEIDVWTPSDDAAYLTPDRDMEEDES